MTDTEARYPKSKRLKTTAATSITKARVIYRKMLADIALVYYNSENGTEFELVEDETLDACLFTDFSGTWSHCSFSAKDCSSINEFFAKIQHVNPSEPTVTTCKILTKGSTKVGCENCKSVTHPMSDDDVIDWKHDKKVVGKYEGSLNRVPYYPTYDPTSPTYKATSNIPAPSFDMAAHVESIHLTGVRIANRALDHYNKTHCIAPKHSQRNLKIKSAVLLPTTIDIGKTKIGCENRKFRRVIHPVEGYRGELLDNTQIVEEDKDYCNKVYEE